MIVIDKIVQLTKQLYPRGRAFWLWNGSFFKKLHEGLGASEVRAFNDGLSTLDSILPDNDNFTVEDATAWERRLGLITNNAVSLADRKAAIIRKMNYPGTIPARQNWRYLEGQLQLAGFNVYIYENCFSDGMGGFVTKTPEEFTGNSFEDVQHGDFQHGDVQHGGPVYPLVVNNLDEKIDATFNIGDNLRSTFFIGGPYPGEYADVDINRKAEFRQLILKIKPLQAVGILLIDYV